MIASILPWKCMHALFSCSLSNSANTPKLVTCKGAAVRYLDCFFLSITVRVEINGLHLDFSQNLSY